MRKGLHEFGAGPAGVDRKDGASQLNRFEQLLRVVASPAASVIEFGCGYGAMLDCLRERGYTGAYRGMDMHRK